MLTSLNRAVLSMGKVSGCKKLTEGSLQRKIEKEIVKLDLKKNDMEMMMTSIKVCLAFFFFSFFFVCMCVKESKYFNIFLWCSEPKCNSSMLVHGNRKLRQTRKQHPWKKKNQHQSAPFRAVSLFLFLLLLETSDLLEPSRPGAKIKGPSEGNQNMQPKCCTQHKRNCYCAVLSLYQCVSF